ncbi:MAG TPA: crotonase/enoyl-CoA hydratase family protein [Aquabacterium sp.]|nr:crotonase/enoyl-CoA hydratase family protein [Aquabacterium sp.]
MNFETVSVSVDNHIATVRLNRPEKANAMNLAMWHDIRKAFNWIDETAEARVAIIEGEGKHFTSGIDLQMMMGLLPSIKNECDGRTRENLRRVILDLQDTLTAIERCRKPVLAAIHGGCVGGGVDLISCTDMRYCSADAYFTIKEIDIGMVADVGTLQRLPKLIGNQGIVRELAYTGRKVEATEAHAIGLVNKVYESREVLQAGVRETAALIAAKSPLSIRGTKEMLNYSRDHSVADGLNYIATWNAAMLMSNDLNAAMMAGMTKQTPVFKD